MTVGEDRKTIDAMFVYKTGLDRRLMEAVRGVVNGGPESGQDYVMKQAVQPLMRRYEEESGTIRVVFTTGTPQDVEDYLVYLNWRVEQICGVTQ